MEYKKTPTKITSERVALVSFLVDISDVVLNLAIASLSGSVVMISQALQGGADLLASGFLVFGVKKSKQIPDKKHPFGYGRETYFWTFLSALFTFVITAGMSFYLGLQRFLNPEPIENINMVLIILVISILTNGYSASLSFRRLLGKNLHKKIWSIFIHSAFITSKTAFVLDLMGTIAAIIGLISIALYKITGELRFDGLGAMLIGITLAILALFILKSAKDLLVGRSASPEVEEKIKRAVEHHKEVKKLVELRTLHLGTEALLVDIDVTLADELTTDEIEKLIDTVKEEIRKHVPEAHDIRVELETSEILVGIKE